ncbi:MULTISPECIES: hypothetical protein [Anaerotruncus]|jgi:hypothetical protein|uniref:hypothetical protein n=1 Tax=Anaerotruncus TaxID=244127 RepID=UPI000E4C30D2|nr:MULTISPECIES: hypothetical protein [Anaerotruncus]RGX52802.1 hypothetical protein DWV16_17660 [Anaerotruncus sp. AF02-27]
MTYKQATQLMGPIYEELKKISTDHDTIVNQLSDIYMQLASLSNAPQYQPSEEGLVGISIQLLTLIQERIIPSSKSLTDNMQGLSNAMGEIDFDLRGSNSPAS